MTIAYQEARRVFEAEIGSLWGVLSQIEPSFDRVIEHLSEVRGKVVVSGIGKSGNVGQKIAATFSSTGTPSLFLNAAEALHGDAGLLQPSDLLLVVSSSGATDELLRLVPLAKSLPVKVVGLLGRTDSPLAEACDCFLHVGVTAEACPLNLAPMSSTTAALVAGDALAAALMKRKGFTSDAFSRLHPSGQLGRRLLLKAADVMHGDKRLPCIPPTHSIRELLLEMSRPNLGIVCIVDFDGKLAGIVTEGDVRRAFLTGKSLADNAGQIMTPHPVTAGPHERLGALLDRMEAKQIYTLPILDESQRPLGLVRMHDILGQQTYG